MKQKRLLRQALSLLLVCLMTVSTPLTALAAEDIFGSNEFVSEDPVVEADGEELENSEETEDVLTSEISENEETADEFQSSEEITGAPEVSVAPETEEALFGDGSEENVFTAGVGQETETLAENREPGSYSINSAEELPLNIYEGQTYKLTADIILAADQQMESVAGVLDGQGHKITLAGKSLVKEVTGIVQNLGIDGSITATSYDGSVCEKLSGGKIYNSYSLADIAVSGYTDPGGLAGLAVNGMIANSYYAGNVTGFYPMPGGLTSYAEKGNVFANCYYNQKQITAVGSEGKGYQITDCAQKTLDEFKNGKVTELLNKGMTLTGYHFEMTAAGMPGLVEGNPQQPSGSVDWRELDSALTEAAKFRKEKYTKESWSRLETAVNAGNELKTAGTEKQEDVHSAAQAIIEAISKLEERDIYKPVAVPSDAVQIASQADFSKMLSSEGKYFVLTQDIEINSNYNSESNKMGYTSFAGVLDGQGHTIRFNKGTALFLRVETGAIIQNVNLTGEIANSRQNENAPFGETLYGSIINCRTEVSGEYASGFVKKLGYKEYDNSKGIIVNCIFVGDTGKGAFYAVDGGGELRNSYAVGINSEEEMTSKDLVEKLNANRGDHGTQWGQGKDGYPYFGKDQNYDGSVTWPELTEEKNKYPLSFTKYNDSQKIILEDRHLRVSPDQSGPSRESGQFALEGYTAPEGAHVEWELTYVRPRASFGRNLDTGMLHVYGVGKAVIEARQVNADGTSEFLATAAILSSKKEIKNIRLLIDGQDVTNGTFTVQGSEWKSISVQAQYDGSETWNNVSYYNFDFAVDESGEEYLGGYSDSYSSIQFKKPGTATITVTPKNQQGISASVTLTSKYVPVENVKPAVDPSYVLHARNANSDGQEADGRVAYNPIHGSAIVSPPNASYADQIEIISSDDSIAYYTGGAKVFVPKQAGKVTFTANVKDTDPNTGKTRIVTGSAETTFAYLNHVVSLQLPEGKEKQSVAAGEETEIFTVKVMGERSEEGYDVTEPALKWNYSKNGIAQIVRKGTGYWKKDAQYEGAPDYGNYLPVADYQIRGLSEGTVIATGTPLDDKNHTEPVQITITVTKGMGNDKNPDALASAGANGALDYIEASHATAGYAYGNEWLIYALLHAGREIDVNVLNSYYDSVIKTVGGWKENQKPTDIERTILALAKMGKDVTNVNGVNLAAMLYNHPGLNAGTNELAYALIALDAADITIPSGAKWTRSGIIKALLTFQAADGGFGLYDNKSSSVDMTAMVLQGLANYRSRPEVKEAVDKAIIYLQSHMRDDFGYGNAEATAQVLLALTALGIDPASSESGFGSANVNMITHLMEYQQEDGGFSHLTNLDKSQEMSTVQVLEALDSYCKRANGSYWNINGVKSAVTFSMYGDCVHDSDADGNKHTLAGGNLEQWIADTEYRVQEGCSVVEIIDKALAANDMTCEKLHGGSYISSVTKNGVTLGEFTNGKYSGWMYTLNGEHPNLSIADQTLKDGDVIVFHYTDDYRKENSSEPEPHVHTWDGGKITTKVTCTENGVKTYTCMSCGETKTETLKATGHRFSGWKTSRTATVFAAASQTRKCSVCGKTETRNYGSKLKPTLKLNTTSIPLKIKQSTKAVKVSGLAAGDYVKSWKSGNTRIVKVDRKGKITAQKKTGKTTITVTLASGKSAKIKVSVQKGAVKTRRIGGLKSKVTLAKGKKMTLKPVLMPVTSKEKIRYASSDKKVASVSSKGVITARRAGKATITVSSGNKKYRIKVTVPKTRTSKILNVQEELKLSRGKSFSLNARVYPKNSDEKLTYSSSDKKIVTVSKNGKLKAMKKGTAIITVRSGKKWVKCKVTVK